MATTWTRWPDFDANSDNDRWFIGPDNGDPVAVTIAATEMQADALAASLDTLASLEEFYNYFVDYDLDCEFPAFQAMKDKALDVIRRAKGVQ